MVESTSSTMYMYFFRLLQRLTLDTIADCGFGLKSESLSRKDNECLNNCRNVIRDTTKRPILFLLGCKYKKADFLL